MGLGTVSLWLLVFPAGFGWSWYPGSRFGHYWYHPAMVGFFGFGANIGWVPLAPFEVFRPWYGPGMRPGIGVAFGVGGFGVVGAFRNAGFATGVAIADFQRGAFNNRFLVNRTQLQQATLVRGALPVAPSALNRQFSARTPAAIGPRASLAGQRFISRPASAALCHPPRRLPAGSVSAKRLLGGRSRSGSWSAGNGVGPVRFAKANATEPASSEVLGRLPRRS